MGRRRRLDDVSRHLRADTSGPLEERAFTDRLAGLAAESQPSAAPTKRRLGLVAAVVAVLVLALAGASIANVVQLPGPIERRLPHLPDGSTPDPPSPSEPSPGPDDRPEPSAPREEPDATGSGSPQGSDDPSPTGTPSLITPSPSSPPPVDPSLPTPSPPLPTPPLPSPPVPDPPVPDPPVPDPPVPNPRPSVPPGPTG